MLNKLRYNSISYKTWHKLIFCHSSFLSPTDQGQKNQATKWKTLSPEKIAEPANQQRSLMLKHSWVRLGENEKLQGTRYEKLLKIQVNWIRKNNILPYFICASVKSSSYRQKMFPNVIKNPEMIDLKGVSQLSHYVSGENNFNYDMVSNFNQ